MKRLQEFVVATIVMTASPSVCLGFQSSTQSSLMTRKLTRKPTTITAEIALFHHSPLSTLRKQSLAPLFATTTIDEITATPKVSSVSVCTAELCNCQEEGLFSGDDILETLKSKNLPYPVEEAPCLGACGGGAMVAIDFEDGSAALVSGIDETLMELGLTTAAQDHHGDIAAIASEAVETSSNIAVDISEAEPSATGADAANPVSTSSAISSTTLPSFSSSPSESDAVASTTNIPTPGVLSKIAVTKTSSPSSPPPSYQDARDRMRAQKQEQAESASNPWWTAATYLAQKAKESIIKESK
ncbi:unnamed protein product [Cylindrotheca closterium]|uniref:Uncharacterized protein n=1 Tax=Cylindrotheca closterium TaxID=2856 RepID=A0AAD2G4C6_9STRA|nr:unnamed protein product [Cylindrotheca closterium]